MFADILLQKYGYSLGELNAHPLTLIFGGTMFNKFQCVISILFLLKSATILSADSAIVINHDQSSAFVVNGSNKVHIINLESHNVSTIPLPDGVAPSGIAIDPNDENIYVTDQKSDSVLVINLNSLVLTKITVGKNPSAIAITLDGHFLYVTNRDSNDVSVINSRTHLITKTISVGRGPCALEYTPDGNFAYVMNRDSNDMSIIDINASKVVNTHHVGKGPCAIAFDKVQTDIADWHFFCVANQGKDEASVLRTKYPEVEQMSVGQSPSDVYAYKARYINVLFCVTNKDSNEISVIGPDISGLCKVRLTIPVGRGPSAIGGAGHFLYAVNKDSNDVTIIDLTTYVPKGYMNYKVVAKIVATIPLN